MSGILLTPPRSSRWAQISLQMSVCLWQEIPEKKQGTSDHGRRHRARNRRHYQKKIIVLLRHNAMRAGKEG